MDTMPSSTFSGNGVPTPTPSEPMMHEYMPWSERIRHFSPAWFYVVMGTTVAALCTYELSYIRYHEATKIVALTFLVFAMLLFLSFSAISIARLIMFPDVWAKMIRHPVDPLYLSCVPMSMIPIQNGMSVGLYSWNKFGGTHFLFFTWAVWFLTTLVGYVICWVVFKAMITKQKHSLKEMSAAWMAPFAGLIVDASAGSLIVGFIRPLNKEMAIITIAWSFATLVIGTTMSILIMAIFVYRLIVEGYPSKMSIFSSFLPLSVMTQAGFTIMVLGDDWATTLPLKYGASTLLQNSAAPEIVRFMSTATGLVMWIMATAWLAWGIDAVISVSRKEGFKFSAGTWSFVFPFGVYAIHTERIGENFDSHFFLILANTLCAITILVVIIMLGITIPKFIKGTIFHAYCLDEDEPMMHSTLQEKTNTASETNTMADSNKMIHELASMQKMA